MSIAFIVQTVCSVWLHIALQD